MITSPATMDCILATVIAWTKRQSSRVSAQTNVDLSIDLDCSNLKQAIGAAMVACVGFYERHSSKSAIWQIRIFSGPEPFPDPDPTPCRSRSASTNKPGFWLDEAPDLFYGRRSMGHIFLKRFNDVFGSPGCMAIYRSS